MSGKDGVKRETRPGNKILVYHVSSLKRITKCVKRGLHACVDEGYHC